MATSNKKKSSNSNKTTKKVVKKTTKAVTKAAKKNPKIFIIILVILLVLALGAVGIYFLMNRNNDGGSSSHEHSSSHVHEIADSAMSINFLELGNKYTGDSTFIKAGDVDILIDAGSRQNSAGTISDFIDQYCSDGKLEYVIATHAHQDHIAGFVGTGSIPGIFDRYQIDTIIDFARTDVSTSVYKNYISKRDAKMASGTKHYTALQCWNETDGAQRVYTISDGIEMEILYQRYYEEATSDENNYSVCVMFNHGDNQYLFTGDLEKDGEASLATKNVLPQVKLFKGGHHGSYTANTDALLSVIKPEVVCICCCAGSDEYTSNPDRMFPAQDAINRIGKYTDQVFVTSVVSDNEDGFTSMNGNITFYSENGLEYSVTGSNNNTILKETDWFKEHRTWPAS